MPLDGHRFLRETGRVLRFDPKSEQFCGDGEANALLTKKHRAPWGFAY